MNEADLAQLQYFVAVLMACAGITGFGVGVALIRFMDWYRSPERC